MTETSWDDDGRLYYYNSATRAVQWNKPPGYQIPVERIARQPWVNYLDYEGNIVWKNMETGVLTSRMPESFREAMHRGVHYRQAIRIEEIDEALIEEQLVVSALRLSLYEYNNSQGQGPVGGGKETLKERAGRENTVLSKTPTVAIPAAVVSNESVSKCTGCFGKNAKSQAPCGCKYCPDCLAGIFIQALEEEKFTQPECCGQILPMELAAPILQRIGIHPNISDQQGKDRRYVEGVFRADDQVKGKAVVGGSKYRAPVETTVDCLICMESMNARDVIKTPCQHNYCHDCMRRLFVESTRNESLYPPKCCNKDIPLTVANTVLNAQQQREFTSKGAEFRTKDRLYCSSQHCSAFIPPRQIYDGIGRCGECRQRTCVFCKGEDHNGDCPKDKDTHAVLKLAQKSGWRKCFNCEYMVMLEDGCNHITCKCGAEFCYACGAKWRTCECGLWQARGPPPWLHVQGAPGRAH